MMIQNHHFIFDEKKNVHLRQTRGLSFELMVALIEMGYVIEVRPHHNMRKYPNQHIMEIRGGEYVYLVPCVIGEHETVLKTIYSSRKAVKKWKEKGKSHG